jgi:predicted permease
MHEWWRAIRRLRRRPASTAAIVVTVALGIGISAGMFSVLHGVALRALPYPNADRLVRIYTEVPSRGPARGGLTRAEVLEGLPDLPGFESTAYYVNEPPYIFTGADFVRRVGVARVSADFFPVFAAPAALGRTFTAAEFEQPGPVTVLSHEAWMELAGGDPGAVGRTLTFAETTVEVVGVLPPSFTESSGDAFIYLPFTASDLGAPRFLYGQRQIVAVGRLAAGTSRATTLDALKTRMAAVDDERRPDDFRYAFVGLLDELVAGVRVVLSGLFTVSLLVLLIACSTAASLVAIRFGQRGTELGLHRALGATNVRIATDLARELVLLAASAGLGGVLVAHFVLAALRPLAAETLPRAEGIAIDAATLWFAAAAALAMVLLTGTASLAALRNDPGKSLRPGARQLVEGGRKPALLPIAAVGMASVALAAALALSVSLAQLRNVDVGFRTRDVVALSLAFDRRPAAEMYQSLDRVVERVRNLPGVADVAAAVGAPTNFALTRAGARLRTDGERTMAVWQPATEDYHRLLGISMRRGRDITATDVEGTQRVAVVNETLARTMFGGEDPLGQTLVLVTGTEPVATPRQASALVLATAARIAAPGVIVAALLALPLFRWLRPQLFGVGETSLWLLFAVAVLVSAAAGLTAALLPARRAARVAPMEALRYD